MFTARYSLTLCINRHFLLGKGLSKTVHCGLELPEYDFTELIF